jgi:hypothetical protein
MDMLRVATPGSGERDREDPASDAALVPGEDAVVLDAGGYRRAFFGSPGLRLIRFFGVIGPPG